MIIKDGEYADIPTPTGPMRLHLFRPVAAGRYPGLHLYSEIYQITGPIRRMAAFLAGQGYLVVAPEVFTSLKSRAPCWPMTRPAPIAATTSKSPMRSRPSTGVLRPGRISAAPFSG